jgi:methylmalonyl-CoA/ethylmalonyl-CoA epimerase
VLDWIDHIGVATDDLDGAIALYEGTLGMPVAHRETVESQGVEAVLLDVGEGHVELLRPLGEDTPVGKYLAKKGPGLHHVAYAVGVRNSRVAFVHPRSTGGVLTEIVEPAH